jgi:hypothetical protein
LKKWTHYWLQFKAEMKESIRTGAIANDCQK